MHACVAELMESPCLGGRFVSGEVDLLRRKKGSESKGGCLGFPFSFYFNLSSPRSLLFKPFSF